MKTHRTDLLSLVPGIVFVAVAVVALLDRLTIDVVDVRWVWPGLLVLLGIAILASTGLGRQDDRSRDPDAATAGAAAAADRPGRPDDEHTDEPPDGSGE